MSAHHLAPPGPATDDIWRQILSSADPRTLLMARLACEAGLRRAEVAQVHTNDLADGIEGPELIVHGKGGKQRVVPITVTLAAEIVAACPHGGYLFPGVGGRPMSADRVGKLVSAVMPPGWSMHKLRHRFATRGYAGTGNLRAVQEAWVTRRWRQPRDTQQFPPGISVPSPTRRPASA